jgi:PadR family transcriptional regulator AphA
MSSRSTKSRYALLGMLSIRAMSGYDIKKLIEASISNFWSESYGQIYPMLKRLVAEKLVTRRVKKQKGKPDRHVYSLTSAGRRVLRDWLVQVPNRSVPRNELLLKLFFGEEVPVEASLAHVAGFRALHSELVARYRAIEHEIRTKHSGNANAPFWLLTVRYGRAESEALLRWCDDAAAALDSIPKRRAAKPRKAPRRRRSR